MSDFFDALIESPVTVAAPPPFPDLQDLRWLRAEPSSHLFADTKRNREIFEPMAQCRVLLVSPPFTCGSAPQPVLTGGHGRVNQSC
jgi:hypothetical protein